MKDKKTKLQEIKELVKRGMSVAVATALVAGTVSLASCDKSHENDNGNETLPPVVDLENPPANIIPDTYYNTPLTEEQQAEVNKINETLSKYDYDFADGVIQSITSIYQPGPEDSVCSIHLNILNLKTNETSGISIPSNLKTLTQLIILANDYKNNNATGIKNVSITEGLIEGYDYQGAKIEMDTENYNLDAANKLLLHLADYLPQETEIPGITALSREEESDFLAHLATENPALINGIDYVRISIKNPTSTSPSALIDIVPNKNNQTGPSSDPEAPTTFMISLDDLYEIIDISLLEKYGKENNYGDYFGSAHGDYTIIFDYISSDTIKYQLLYLIQQIESAPRILPENELEQ